MVIFFDYVLKFYVLIQFCLGDIPPYGKGPDQQKIQTPTGQEYLRENYPDLDYLLSCTLEIVPPNDHLLRGADEIHDKEVQELKGPGIVPNSKQEETAANEEKNIDGDGLDVETPGIAEQRESDVTKKADSNEPGIVPSGLAELKPPSKPRSANSEADYEEGKSEKDRFYAATIEDDDDDGVFDNRKYDRDLKIRIIFLLLFTVLGMLIYNIWRQQRKLRAGKLT